MIATVVWVLSFIETWCLIRLSLNLAIQLGFSDNQETYALEEMLRQIVQLERSRLCTHQTSRHFLLVIAAPLFESIQDAAPRRNDLTLYPSVKVLPRRPAIAKYAHKFGSCSRYIILLADTGGRFHKVCLIIELAE